MNKDKQQLRAQIEAKTVSADEVFEGFTSEQHKIAHSEIKYYDMLLSLKTLRKKLNLTQAELAKKSHLPRTTITKIESGAHNPTISTLMAIANAMNKKIEIKLS